MSVFNNGIEILKIMNNGVEISKMMQNGVEVFTKFSAPSHENEAINGSITDGFNGWDYDGITISTAQYVSSPQSFLQSDRAQFAGQSIVGAVGDKFYCVCMGYHESGSAQTNFWSTNYSDFGNYNADNGILTDTWEKLSFIHTALDLGMRVWVAHYTYAEACVNYYDDIMVVNLTELYGTGNEPDLAWCDANLDFVL